jgi:site-specific recombinase XerD
MNHHTLAMHQHACYKPTKLWPRANLFFYAEYREWLKQSFTGPTRIACYTAVARWVFCLIDKPYWQIDPHADIARVQTYFDAHFDSAATRKVYRLALARFATFLRLKCHQPPPPKQLRWNTYVGSLPAPLANDIRAFLAHCQARWPARTCHERSQDTLATLTRPLRHMLRLLHLSECTLAAWSDLTPRLWWHYTESRLANGISTRTLNTELHQLHAFLHFVADLGRPIHEPFFRVEPFKPVHRLPQDVPVEQVRRVLQAAHAQSLRQPINQSRLGLLDTAWLTLMLHCGLRTGEVRALRPGDIDWQRRFIRIEQSKGLKDRRVPMSDAVIAAVRAYLAVRGPAEALPDEVFVFQHKPLSREFCRHRLRFYERQTGVHVTPHQLRHTCATLLLNAGMPATTVKLILGHVHLDTTLGYARVYDGTLAADYTRAMLSVERMFDLTPETSETSETPETPGTPETSTAPLSAAHIVALLDALKAAGALNAQQLDVLATARAAVVGQAQV